MTNMEIMENAKTATLPTAIISDIESQRAIAEVQGAITIAKRFPRNIQKALDLILNACQRSGLAESALYSYARGGTEITGPSIRLAEAIAQNWGNLQFGIKELEQRNGESIIQAYAWDVETNTKQEKTFTVKHIRKTKKGSYALDDPRDIYELTANNGARRLRACILGLIPGDIVEAAVNQCEETLKASADTSQEAIKKLISAFENYKVSKEQIEKRIQRRLDSITPAQIVGLRKIYNSLKDGMSTPADWFEPISAEEMPQPTSGVEAAKAALKKGKEKKQTENPPPAMEEPTTKEFTKEQWDEIVAYGVKKSLNDKETQTLFKWVAEQNNLSPRSIEAYELMNTQEKFDAQFDKYLALTE